MTDSRFFWGKSRIKDKGEAVPLKNQTWATGVASTMCPILSRLTRDRVTSTPHLSQTIPLYLTLLYFPQ